MYSKNKKIIIINNNMQKYIDKSVVFNLFLFLIIGLVWNFIPLPWYIFPLLLLVIFSVIFLPIICISKSLSIIFSDYNISNIKIFFLTCFLIFTSIFISVFFDPGFIIDISFMFLLLINLAMIKIIKQRTSFFVISLIYILALIIFFFLYIKLQFLFWGFFLAFLNAIMATVGFVFLLITNLKYFLDFIQPSKISMTILFLIIYFLFASFYIIVVSFLRNLAIKNRREISCVKINNTEKLLTFFYNKKRRLFLVFIFIINIFFSIYSFNLSHGIANTEDAELVLSMLLIFSSIFIIFESFLVYVFIYITGCKIGKNIIDFLGYSLFFFFFFLYDSFFILRHLSSFLGF